MTDTRGDDEVAMDLDDKLQDEQVGEEVEPDHDLDLSTFSEMRDDA